MSSLSVRAGLFAAMTAAVAAAAFAQSSATPSVMTDVAPLPAEERDSVGAIVLPNSMVRAQREALGPNYLARTHLERPDREAARATRAARTREELAEQRDAAAMRLREMGAGALAPP